MYENMHVFRVPTTPGVFNHNPLLKGNTKENKGNSKVFSILQRKYKGDPREYQVLAFYRGEYKGKQRKYYGFVRIPQRKNTKGNKWDAKVFSILQKGMQRKTKEIHIYLTKMQRSPPAKLYLCISQEHNDSIAKKKDFLYCG